MKRFIAYYVNDGDEVMEALVAGWPSALESEFAAEGNALGVMRAGEATISSACVRAKL